MKIRFSSAAHRWCQWKWILPIIIQIKQQWSKTVSYYSGRYNKSKQFSNPSGFSTEEEINHFFKQLCSEDILVTKNGSFSHQLLIKHLETIPRPAVDHQIWNNFCLEEGPSHHLESEVAEFKSGSGFQGRLQRRRRRRPTRRSTGDANDNGASADNRRKADYHLRPQTLTGQHSTGWDCTKTISK